MIRKDPAAVSALGIILYAVFRRAGPSKRAIPLIVFNNQGI